MLNKDYFPNVTSVPLMRPLPYTFPVPFIHGPILMLWLSAHHFGTRSLTLNGQMLVPFCLLYNRLYMN
ncbi:hypothetical protein BU24DRAFT_218449 [Aaosphaeria arxii CBS 175.79]|uniref:Uncharacterized protein n=1 Tax=Aaosphaeria arxii CBS 175.79 TaxID=1450172 RepID=A0A6A5XPF0_9PLEO|nr:uncharacterized protein BU24DRAFT_218449 [Aaosphaeria arxii CBS 175.79]KAF2014641.1 hypothetical protein BU24DRAFT_218449 [Aaosphaeria arxii CBS 175.79]